ncbi:MAG: response regulator transcription factor [Paludibacteraceae bacterium]|nr:response regulator transcription factor [Paludibacteraceae bacterium]
MTKTKVIIADDHRMVAEALQQLINNTGKANVCAIAGTIEQTAEIIKQTHPDIFLLDIAMPDGDGIDAVEQLKKLSPNTRIIMLTMYAEPSVIQRAINSNVDGYLLKSNNIEEMCTAIEEVAKGNKYFSESVEEIAATQTENYTTLTPRERDILRLIVNGKTNKEIAEELFLGFETVHSYTKYIRQKLGCTNMATLVRTAIEQHLV